MDADVKISVGGKLFRTRNSTLKRYPKSLLGTLTTSSVYYDEESSMYVFDRNPLLFNQILDIYRNGEIHIAGNMCGHLLRKEMQFWGLPFTCIAECCLPEFLKYEDDIAILDKLRKNFSDLDYTDEECRNLKYKKVLRKIWLTIDQPMSSIYGRIFNYIFMAVVVISMVSFVLGSHPSFRKQILEYDQLLWIIQMLDVRFFDSINLNNPKEVMFATTMASPTLAKIDLFCMIFFTLEFVIHFATSPKKIKFFTFPLNILDPFLLIAMWTTFAFESNLEFMIEREAFTILYQILKAFVVLRLFRFFRIVKLHSGIKIIMFTMYSSISVLFLLFIAFVVAALFFASFVYYAEFHIPDEFPTVFASMWWAIITMTTVGYGDMYPTSTVGHIVGAACAFFGILIIAMPISVVTTNFFTYYQKNKEREQQDTFKTGKRKKYLGRHCKTGVCN